MSAWRAATSATARRTSSRTTFLTSGSAMSSPRPSVASQIVRFCLGPVEPARHVIGHARAGAAAHGRRQLFLAQRAEPLEQRDVDLLAAAEVVVHEPAGYAGGARDVLDRDLVVGALGEQRVGRVEDLLAPLPGIETAELGRAHKGSVNVVGDPSRHC